MSKFIGRSSPMLLLALCSPLFAQFAQRAAISGSVSDQSGGAIPNVTVELYDLDQKTSLTTRTNADGQYTFTQLNIGHYQLGVNQPGFGDAGFEHTGADCSAECPLRFHAASWKRTNAGGGYFG